MNTNNTTYDLLIIGAGPAGYMAAERAGQTGLKTLLFDKKYLGGVCLNEGCIPTKTLLYTAKIYESARSGIKYGIHADNVRYDFPAIMKRKDKVVKKLVAGVGNTLKKYGVETIFQQAYIKGKTSKGFVVESEGTEFLAKNLLIATGSEPVIPDIPGLQQLNYFTNREILQIPEIPEELTILGAGYVGIEFAAFFSAMGTKVTVVELMPEILPGMDRDIIRFVKQELSDKNVEFKLSSKVIGIEKNNLIVGTAQEIPYKASTGTINGISPEEAHGNGNEASTKTKTGIETGNDQDISQDAEAVSAQDRIPFKNLLISIGRKPTVENIGLENLGTEFSGHGIKTDFQCRTNIPNVYAAGDVNGISMLAHTAYREAGVVVNNLSGRRDQVRYNTIPTVVYSNPELASVGLTEEMARENNINYEARQMPMAYSGRFMAENEGKNGLAKILVGKKYGEILGVHLAGNPASELIWGAAMMIENELRLKDVEEIVFPHPTVSEILRETIFSFKGS
jgi:dihydrolipoamide dehydrogenase